MRKTALWILVSLGVVASIGCDDHAPAEQGHADDHDHTTGQEPTAHDGHDHQDAADLDQSVETLFAQDCEHNIKAHACDACRYEVGVVKATQHLFEGGLLKTEKVTQRRVSVPLALTGEVAFDTQRVAHVSAQTEGIIRNVFVTLGDEVQSGQPLLAIDSVALGEAQAAYLEARGMLTLARRSHERQATLRREGISSEKNVLQAKQDLDVAQIRTEAALGKLMRLGMRPSAARGLTQTNAVGQLVLRAPAKGTVLDIHAVAGEVAQAQRSLLTVGDNRALWVWADLYEKDIAVVMARQAENPLAATVAVKAFPDETFAGTVDIC